MFLLLPRKESMSLRSFKIDKHISVDIHHEIDGEAMAEMFWAMDDHEMAAFFNELGFILRDKPVEFQKQMLAVAMNKDLDEYGIAAVTGISLINEFKREGDHA